MHAVRTEVLQAQADAAGLPLITVNIPHPCPNDVYETQMSAAIANARADGFTHVAFGDLFLEDVRSYREDRMKGTGLTPIFPLWLRPTDTLARHMLEGGLEAYLTCVDPRVVPASLAGRRFDARLIGLDERVDLALLKIDATGLPVAPLGDSNRTRVGEFVLALGHPFGLEQTVSFGIVSRKGSPIQVAAPGFEFIQTDAAVNPGNSGGPLVNMAGEVVGVNSMAAVNGSIGFAIPVNLVKALLPQLAEKGKVEWGWLGVTIAEVPDEEAARFGLKEPKGVLIRQVAAGQPADQGGIKANDVVVSVDGASVEGPRDLQRIISSTPVGKVVKISLMREGKETEVAVTVGAYQTPPMPRVPRRMVPAPRPPAPQQPR